MLMAAHVLQWALRLRVPGAFGVGAFVGAAAACELRQQTGSAVARPSDALSDAGSLPESLADAVPRSVYRRVAVSPTGDGFLADFDGATRNPRWVTERLTAASINGGGGPTRAGLTFHEDRAIPPHLRARLAAFSASGWDRGHLAAAANHPSDPAADGDAGSVLRDSFLLSNVSPQSPAMNRGPWAGLEAWLRGLLRKREASSGSGNVNEEEEGGAGGFDELLVCTGPLWVPQHWSGADSGGRSGSSGTWRHSFPALGAPLGWVAVPTHFYKVVLGRRLDGGGAGSGGGWEAAGAFVLPNAPPPDAASFTRLEGRSSGQEEAGKSRGGSAPFRPADCAVPILAVEALAGLEVRSGMTERAQLSLNACPPPTASHAVFSAPAVEGSQGAARRGGGAAASRRRRTA